MKFLKTLCLLLTLSAFFATSAFAQDDEFDRLPEVTLKDMDGKSVNVADYGENGKITVMSFWATWCGPCKKELNNIAERYDRWQDEFGLEVIAVSVDDQRSSDKVKTYVNGVGWEYDVLLDVNEDLKRQLNFQTVPYTIVVDSEGDILYEHGGYVEGDENELEEIIKEIKAYEEE